MAYLAAERAILSGQSYELEGLKLTRADLSVVQKKISELIKLDTRLAGAASGVSLKRVVPVDF